MVHVPTWLKALGKAAPKILALTPLAAIAPAVQQIIVDVEASGKPGHAKLTDAVVLTVDAAVAARAAGVNIDPALVEAAAGQAISAVVDVAKIATDLHQEPLRSQG